MIYIPKGIDPYTLEEIGSRKFSEVSANAKPSHSEDGFMFRLATIAVETAIILTVLWILWPLLSHVHIVIR